MARAKSVIGQLLEPRRGGVLLSVSCFDYQSLPLVTAIEASKVRKHLSFDSNTSLAQQLMQ